jgi:hypothetical protein
MAARLKIQRPDTLFLFANTGREHPATLDFVDRCDRHFDLSVVWLEAVVSRGRVGIRHKTTDYFSAARNGEPFEAYIEKYGIPNKGSPQCTSRLKTEVLESYLRSVGYLRGKRLNYETAIGIRADEADRCSVHAERNKFIYPLVKWGVTKAKVLSFWRSQPFDLALPGEHYGNCVTCWKKSDRKLLTIAKNTPSDFDFEKRMELMYSGHKASTGRRVFYRGHRSAADLLQIARTTEFSEYRDADVPQRDESMDVGGSCGESCEIGADE